MSEHPLLALGVLFLILLSFLTIVVTLAHVVYIQRVAHRISYQDGQIDLVLDTLSRQNNMLVAIMENK